MLPNAAGSGRILLERKCKYDFLAFDSAGVTETDTEIERFGATRPRNVRQLKRFEKAFRTYVFNDPQERRPAYAFTLKPGIDHEAPYAHLGVGPAVANEAIHPPA